MKRSIQLNQPSWAVLLALALVAGLAILLLLPQRVQMDRLATAPTLSTLYEKIGGKDTLVALVDEFMHILSADQRARPFFEKTDLVRFKERLIEQLCEALGGPCKYSGRSMKEAHAGLGITQSDFAHLIEDFVMAMDKLKWPEDQKKALIQLLDRMEPDIVEKNESP